MGSDISRFFDFVEIQKPEEIKKELVIQLSQKIYTSIIKSNDMRILLLKEESAHRCLPKSNFPKIDYIYQVIQRFKDFGWNLTYAEYDERSYIFTISEIKEEF